MIRLALLRHGHTAWNRQGRIQGRSDIPLDEDAKAHLARLALPPEWQDCDLWSSPLQRAVETAQIITGHPPKTDLALGEMNWGDWEGQEGIKLRADPQSGYRDIEDWGWNYRPPKGESPADLSARLRPWVETLRRDAFAVCHIGIMRVLMAQATGWDFTGPPPFQIKRNRLFVITIRDGKWSANDAPIRLPERAS
ncbi:2,3-bisphosphoglycerate-dependent phosphoglycerate mutase [Roseobacter fucihabitans]|uniref:2,3-bisphosphoglycerate-dependent phosphoglycerate mutase n=1 Tax=Roseobacter fucihabitans TaxID=1537242 RepID=A0ABZ2BVK5_9RHOB|nr:histidine phosphatase family protein [Roseobacter litoralis]MBC6964980.1 Glucosyl-3-phosphoglycerate phosphatase [Roseobacter litoralis]